MGERERVVQCIHLVIQLLCLPAYDCNAVVQKYVDDPMTICGYKFDLRIYVCVPSFHPLTLYLYEEGLVRYWS